MAIKLSSDQTDGRTDDELTSDHLVPPGGAAEAVKEFNLNFLGQIYSFTAQIICVSPWQSATFTASRTFTSTN